MTEIPGGWASVRELVTRTLGDLSNSERKVGRALLADFPAAGLTTVADLAGRAGVSPPTVIRFVTRLGLPGFPALQRLLVHELHQEQGSPLRQIADKRAPDDGVLASTYRSFAAMLAASWDELPASEFDRLVSLLADPARDVRVAGGRFSRMLAEYLVVHLRLLRPGVTLVGPDELDRRDTIVDAGDATVLVAYDYRRYTDLTFRLARQMADRGATVCLLTDNWLSPIATVATVVLPTRVESSSPFDSLVAATAVTESVVAAVAQRRGERGVARLREVEEAE